MWKTVKLGDACLARRGTTITKKNAVEGDVPVIGGGTKPTYFHNEPNREAGCITISGSGASAGFVNRWDMPIFASDCSTVEPKDEMQLPKFLYYYLLSQQQFIYDNFRSGAAQPHVYAKDIETLDFPILPLAEQERIVAKLDAAFAEMEALNKLISIRKAELAKLKKACLKTLSSEKSDLINLGDVCELIYGKGLDKIDRLENDGIPAYGANGVKTYSTKILSDEPSIIIGRKGSAGELTRVSVAFWALDVTYYTKINKKLIDLDFLYYTLSSMDLPSMAKGVKPGINRNDVYKRLIYLPTLEEQKHIVSILDAAYLEIEIVNDLVSKLKNNFDALKSAILTQELQPSEAA